MEFIVTCPHCGKTGPARSSLGSINSNSNLTTFPSCPSCNKEIRVEIRNGQIYRVG